MTLYQGPAILSSPLKSEISKNLHARPSNWVVCGILLSVDAIFASMYIVSQAFVLKKYPAVIILVFANCFVCSILSGVASLIVEADLSSFDIRPKMRLLAVLYSGIFGYAFQVTVQSWCVRKRGPLFVAMFHPVGIVISNLIGVIFLGDGLYLGRSSDRPPLTFNVLCGFVIVGLFGFLAQIFGYTGVSLSSATLGTTLLNLIPGFTFVLAIFCRMEIMNIKSSITQAKFIGTIVSIAGAIIMTLYQGPAILPSLLESEISNNLVAQPSNWVLGGFLLSVDAIFASMYIVSQAFVLKKYPAVIILMFAYCFVCTILSGVASLVVEADLSSFDLRPKMRLLAILYSGIFGYAFQVTVQSWCVRKRGPLFVAMFHPVGIVISNLIGVIFLGDGFYLGSLLGSIVVVVGFYTVMWGKAKEQKAVMVNPSVTSKVDDAAAPLLADVEEQITPPLP